MSRTQVKYAVVLKPIRIGTTEEGEAITAQPGEVIDVTDWRGNAVDSNMGTGHLSLLPTDPSALRTLADSIEEAQAVAEEASEERQRRLKKPVTAVEADDESDEEAEDKSESSNGEDEDSDEDDLPDGLTAGAGGWYTASDGEKVRGREDAVEYQQMLNDAEAQGSDEEDADE